MSRKERRQQKGSAKLPAALGHSATSPSVAAGLRIVRLQREAMKFSQAGQSRRALTICRELLALQPTRPDLLSFAGTLAFKLGDMDEAAALHHRAVAAKPDAADFHYNLGSALGQLGRFEEAAAAHRKALTLRPDFWQAHHNLANALRTLGRLADAVESYRRGLACHTTADGERDLGIALHDLHQLDGAIAAYRRSLALPGHRVDVYSNLANALMERGDSQEALDVCGRYLAIEPGNIEALALKVLALHELGHDEKAHALLDFDRFVRIIDFTEPPAAFPDLAAFNQALAAHVEAHPTLGVPPRPDPTYHNDALEITGELFTEPKGPMAAFETMMRLHRDGPARSAASVYRAAPQKMGAELLGDAARRAGPPRSAHPFRGLYRRRLLSAVARCRRSARRGRRRLVRTRPATGKILLPCRAAGATDPAQGGSPPPLPRLFLSQHDPVCLDPAPHLDCFRPDAAGLKAGTGYQAQAGPIAHIGRWVSQLTVCRAPLQVARSACRRRGRGRRSSSRRQSATRLRRCRFSLLNRLGTWDWSSQDGCSAGARFSCR
jgi:tetratricopeptide (TPR) repeat protein